MGVVTSRTISNGYVHSRLEHPVKKLYFGVLIVIMGKHKKKPARLCLSCGFKPSTPTGRNCTFEVQKLEELPAEKPMELVKDGFSDEDN